MNRKWTCHVCKTENNGHITECSCGNRRRARQHESVCEKCGKSTIRPLIHIVKDRGNPRKMTEDIRTVGYYHIDPRYRGDLRIGAWVCFECANPDMSSPNVSDVPRSCMHCGARLRSSNQKMWCELCHVNEGHDKDCRGCGGRLDRTDYLYCPACEGKRPVEAPQYMKPTLSGGMLSTLKPMKPGPGGIKSRNRAGMSLIEIEEELNLEIRRRSDRRVGVAQHVERLRRIMQQKKDAIGRCRDEGNHVGVLVLRGEIENVRKEMTEPEMRLEKLDKDLLLLRQALASTKEVHTWRMVIPGQFDRPPKRGEVRGNLSEKWRSVVPVTQDDIDAEWLDPIRHKPKPPFIPTQDGERKV